MFAGKVASILDGKGVLFQKPEEYAKIENGELVFPMTEWNYRMIVIEAPENYKF